MKTLVLLLALAASGLQADFDALDAALGNSLEAVHRHESRIDAVRSVAYGRDRSPSRLYEAYGHLYELYYPFQFDGALDALNSQEEQAALVGDPSAPSEVALSKAILYATAGMYLEASQAAAKVDTLTFGAAQMQRWYDFRQRFCHDFWEYGGSDDQDLFRDARYYRDRIIATSSPDSFIHQEMLLCNLVDSQDNAAADSVGRALVERLDPSSHEYAIASYYLSIACHNRGLMDEELRWLVRSATADCLSAVKDNASLYTVALRLLDRGEVARAFRYTQTALDDALYYNAKLRPLQIARSLPSIEKAYDAQRESQLRRVRFLVLAVSILAAVLLLICFLMLKVRRSERKANVRLSEANAAKEEYLGLFLSMSSGYLDKLRKHLTLAQMDEELKNFYNSFDNAFLQLYPNFVEEFNALLEPEARVALKKGELLNTELRIFALVRLGITQSSHIASLLRYSVNTIYNYRAQVKAAAINGKEAFEDQVKAIGRHH